MEPNPAVNATNLQTQTEQSPRSHNSPVLGGMYMTGRMIMVCIVIYFLIKDISDELQYPYHWLGFLTIHMILECSVTYSDPLWNSKYIEVSKIHIHSILAVTALISAMLYFIIRKVTLLGIAGSNSTNDTSSSNNMQPKGHWHCDYSYWFLSLILAIVFLVIFITGVIVGFRVRLSMVYLSRLHKYGGTLVTYSISILLVCNVLRKPSAPINWIILILIISAYVLMPIRIVSHRSVNI